MEFTRLQEVHKQVVLLVLQLVRYEQEGVYACLESNRVLYPLEKYRDTEPSQLEGSKAACFYATDCEGRIANTQSC